MENNFNDIINIIYLDSNQKSDRKEFMDAIKIAKSKISKCICKHEMYEFFSIPKQKSRSTTIDENFVTVRQINYVHLFLILYLGYLNKLVTGQLNENFGND